MKITKERVIQSLKKVLDPDIKKDLVTLQMIENVQVEGKRIAFKVVLTTPACPLQEKIRKDCENTLKKDLGEDIDIAIQMTSNVTTIRNNGPVLPGVKNIIAIASGKGGVGKSTVTSNLAIALSRLGADVGLIDADIFGPSQPTMFNCEHEKPEVIQKDGKNRLVPIEQYGVKLMSIGFLAAPDEAVIWRGPMASSALRQFIADAEWGALDYLLIDLPPGTSDIHLTLVQAVPVTGALIVTTPQKVALTDAQKGIAMFRQPQINVPVLGLIENMAYFTPPELPDKKYFIFGEGGGERLAKKYEVPLLGQLPIEPTLRESGDSGYPSALKDDDVAEKFQSLASALARQIAIRNAKFVETKRVEINL